MSVGVMDSARDYKGFILRRAGLTIQQFESDEPYGGSDKKQPSPQPFHCPNRRRAYAGGMSEALARSFETAGPESLSALRARRRDIERIAAEHGVVDVRVFGSVARGEARPDSDIDLLVEMAPGRSLLDMGAFLVDMELLLGRAVDVITAAGLRSRIRERVLREALPL